MTLIQSEQPVNEASYRDPDAHYFADFAPQSDVLLIAFAGLRGRIGIPAFEFMKLTEPYGVKRLFLRDQQRRWYHRGIPGFGSSIDEVAGTLRQHIAGQNIQRVVTVGNSLGGYAALLFGWLLNADIAISFAPQSVVGPKRILFGDFGILQYWTFSEFFTAARSLDSRYSDLKALFNTAHVKTQFNLYYSAHNVTDSRHAERMRMPDVNLFPQPESAHNMAKTLRDRNLLSGILAEAIRKPHQP
jgi:pimeloyl-ACP methyl ester carboxylesterase